MNIQDLQRSHGMPVDADGPVFHAPWQAQAFAMVVQLQEQGLFSAGEWAEQLGHCITAAQARGDADLGDTYYDHWLRLSKSCWLPRVWCRNSRWKSSACDQAQAVGAAAAVARS